MKPQDSLDRFTAIVRRKDNVSVDARLDTTGKLLHSSVCLAVEDSPAGCEGWNRPELAVYSDHQASKAWEGFSAFLSNRVHLIRCGRGTKTGEMTNSKAMRRQVF